MSQRLGAFFFLMGTLLELLFVRSVMIGAPIYDLFFLGVILWVIGGVLLSRSKN